MIKHIGRMIWNQRRANGWIFAELLVVAGVVWTMMDGFYVDLKTYHSPLGYDVTHVWRFMLSKQTTLDQETGLSDPEKLTRLMNQIRQNPEVEEVCATYYSCPYSMGNSWRGVRPLDGDTTLASETSFQVRNVTPEYFRLFQVKTPEGKPVYDEISGVHNALILSREMAEAFYHGQPACGRKIRYGEFDDTFTVAAVSSSIRSHEYVRPEPCFFQSMNGSMFNRIVEGFGAHQAEICVRMKKEYTREEMNSFLDGMGERLTVGNLFVYGINNIQLFRDIQLGVKDREMSKAFSLMLFMLANVFFGIIGTFWLRMQHRRGEVGLRKALGADRGMIERGLYMEGLCLLACTFPFVVLLVANLMWMDYPDTYRMPFTAGRFWVTMGATYGLIAVMIGLGIWFPIRRIIHMPPAEALRYE